ncbi:subtilisin-like protein, partial [Nadsonia fulvescens var. elongata DSM 6958]
MKRISSYSVENFKQILIILMLVVNIQCAFLVQLSESTTMEKFVNSFPSLATNVTNRFSFSGFQGFSGSFNRQFIKEMLANPSVIRIVRDHVVLASEVQYDAPRHLARIAQRHALPPPTAEINTTTPPISLEYCYDEFSDMVPVDAYVLDSGIYKDHPELEGRARFGADFTNEGHGDFNGHGTHVAGLIGSKTYGSAKGITLIEVKVLNRLGAGLISWVISGLEFAVQDHLAKKESMRDQEEGVQAAVINISLGTAFNQILNDAVNAAVRSGIVVVVAAGNN